MHFVQTDPYNLKTQSKSKMQSKFLWHDKALCDISQKISAKHGSAICLSRQTNTEREYIYVNKYSGV